jgi:hypothetical protein
MPDDTEAERPQEPEAHTQDEIREQAAGSGDDPHTAREELEVELMDEDESSEGEHIGEPTS